MFQNSFYHLNVYFNVYVKFVKYFNYTFSSTFCFFIFLSQSLPDFVYPLLKNDYASAYMGFLDSLHKIYSKRSEESAAICGRAAGKMTGNRVR